jgi:acetyl-CoA carboxylase biotin carboxylase subunit
MKVLVANRGEIAVRIIRACRDLGWRSVAVYSDADRGALHTRLADEAHHLGSSAPAESYLNAGRILDAARRRGAALVHPGYGFLAENAEFAQACADAGLTFVGPLPDAIRRMGDKARARHAAAAAGVPVVPGTADAFAETVPAGQLLARADELGYPLLVKAVAGGGGKGMRSVSHAGALPGAVRDARSEARSAFGDGTVYLERRLTGARHIEIQLLADASGTVIPFVERECSIQRRHQKLVEESPSAAVGPGLRRAMAEAAVGIARRVGYVNAGTIEFLVDAAGAFYFLEMNTRLQVEHPVTEAVTGIDLVRWQLRIAAGDRLAIPEGQAISPRGHAIECRVYAEDPDRGFLPSPGRIGDLHVPAGPGIRDDSGVAPGFEIPVAYDSLISKLIVWGGTREEALSRLSRALDEYRVGGVPTTIPFFQWLVADPAFLAGEFDTTYLDAILAARAGAPFGALSEDDRRDATIAAAVAHYLDLRRARPAPAADSRGGEWRRAARAEGLR